MRITAIQRLTSSEFSLLENPGFTSEQIVWPSNAPGAHVTITRVRMQPGAISDRHSHTVSEQTWLIEEGEATLLMDGGGRAPLHVGDVVRTPPGEVHGVKNTGPRQFVYLAITSPPQDFSAAYQHRKDDR